MEQTSAPKLMYFLSIRFSCVCKNNYLKSLPLVLSQGYDFSHKTLRNLSEEWDAGFFTNNVFNAESLGVSRYYIGYGHLFGSPVDKPNGQMFGLNEDEFLYRIELAEVSYHTKPDINLKFPPHA